MRVFLLLFLTSSLFACDTKQQIEQHKNETAALQQSLDTLPDKASGIATLGAGCFWCVEAVFQELKGVKSVKSGYMGGSSINADYKKVSSGNTDHVEVAQITFDPDSISFDIILKVFWSTHDPTTLNRQGNDYGTQYRSVVFCHSTEQVDQANASKSNVATELWGDKIVTTIEAAGQFYDAESYHQNFYTLNPDYGYCRAVINPKMAKFRAKFKDYLK